MSWSAEIEEEQSNLAKAKRLVREQQELTAVMRAYKAAFKNDELDGGWKAALTHPTYLEAEKRLAEIDNELKGLI